MCLATHLRHYALLEDGKIDEPPLSLLRQVAVIVAQPEVGERGYARAAKMPIRVVK